MIITKIQGGLGNQMFQYAVGRHLAHLNKTELKLDLSFYDYTPQNDTPREYLLGNFNIIGKPLNQKETKKIKINNFHNKSFLARAIRKILKIIEEKKPIYKRKYIREPHFHFCPLALKARSKKDIYLYGNWQSEKYFIGIEDIIRKEFTLKNGFSKEAQNMLNKIQNNNSVSIHIRRGDYVSNKNTNAFHGTCFLDYYYEAIKKIQEKIKNPYFFIFSDDVLWAKENLKINKPLTLVSGSNIKDIEEMLLMSKCKHNIIANSSFSWWGAWLNNNPDKVVIAPWPWFNNLSINTDDLYPKNWIKIKRPVTRNSA